MKTGYVEVFGHLIRIPTYLIYQINYLPPTLLITYLPNILEYNWNTLVVCLTKSGSGLLPGVRGLYVVDK